MATYLYLNMVPESLVASMLAPSAFGTYLATGTHKRSRGPAIFFDLRPDFPSDYFDLADTINRCAPHPDGQPKHSVYGSIYRVLEHVPLSAMKSLWLVTMDGRVLELKAGELPARFPGHFHLYQEVCPVHPMIASSLDPLEFTKFITDPSMPISVPKICFVDLELADLAEDPRGGSAGNLPYTNITHLRDCLLQLAAEKDKRTKTVDRVQQQACPYRCVKSGFFVGDQQGRLYYSFPSRDELEDKYYDWWRSANV